MIDVSGSEKRRQRSVQEKIAIVQQSFEPSMTVSLVPRQYCIAASQLFLWPIRKAASPPLPLVKRLYQLRGLCDEANQRAASSAEQEDNRK